MSLPEPDEFAQWLRYYADLGVREVYAPRPEARSFRPTATEPARGASRAAAAPTRLPQVEPPARRPPAPLPSRAPDLPPVPLPFADLPSMASFLHDCTRCPLSMRRTQVVFGVGNPKARLLFVGEGPGEEEDLRGEPFVGKAGQLLTDMIVKGMGLERADVYIANVVKCRPPGNRNPEPAEIDACSVFLREQVRLVAPEVIVTLGKFAAHALLGVDTPITRLRGRWGEYEGIPVMPTFHPAYLLRTPAAKKEAWADLKDVMARLGLAVPVR